MENWNHDKSNTHTLTGIHTAHRGPRPAKSVLALVHLAAGGQKATADCFLVQLVLVHLQLLELPALQQKAILQVDKLLQLQCFAVN